MCKWYLLCLKCAITYLITDNEPHSTLELSHQTLHKTLSQKKSQKKDLTKIFFKSYNCTPSFEDRVHRVDLQRPKKLKIFKTKFNKSFFLSPQWYFITFKPHFDVF